ncbi:MAG: DNA polymerase III subunit chi [Alphaproteobacteria bacterium]|nr:DNA polymerase III subunit chi [Alphaproteobacteria bacterium]
MAEGSEVLFYQLDRQPLEQVLPSLVEKTLERGWRAVIQSGNARRLEALDNALWTYRDDSFLPHGTKADGDAETQPVYLTTEDDNPNEAGVRFLVDGATISGYDGYIRVVHMFDGRDTDAVQQAREAWRAATDAGCTATYWQQGENGGWQKKASR